MSRSPSVVVDDARRLLRERDHERALARLHAGLEETPEDWSAQELLGLLLFRLKRYDEAADAFRQLTRLDPRDPGAWVNLGAVLNLLKDYKGASEALRKAIQRDKDCAVAYYNLAIAQKGQREFKMAISAYQECLRLDPKNTEASINLGILLLDQKNYRKALPVLQAALEHASDNVKLQRLLKRAEQDKVGSRVEESPFGRLVDEKTLAEKQKALRHRELTPAMRNRERELMRESARELRHAIRPMVTLLDESFPQDMHTLLMAVVHRDSRYDGYRAWEGLSKTLSELEQARETVTENIATVRSHLQKTDPGL